MSAVAPSIKGWCPTALRPMDSGDGLLVRVHVTGAALASPAFAALGELAHTHGNGFVDLTQRGNLQLRGVTSHSLPALIAALAELGLAGSPTESSASRNVICVPTIGFDPAACFDAAAVARDLEERLTSVVELRALPDKFCFGVDDGGCFGLDGVPADIRLIGFEGRVVVALAKSRDAFSQITVTEIPDAIDAALALAKAFLKRRTGTIRRMYDLVEQVGVTEITEAAGFDSHIQSPPLPLRATTAQDVIGLRDGFVGVAVPYGQLQSDHMQLIAAQAPQGIRLTPWRSVLLAGATVESLKSLEAAGLIISPEDPRLMIVTCPGSPACGSAHIDTRQAAERLAPLLADTPHRGVALHISACSKGCAHAVPAPLTIVGRDGGFDLVRQGRADDEPLLKGLNLADLVNRLQELCLAKEAV
jgi:precorrin-3B synthase